MVTAIAVHTQFIIVALALLTAVLLLLVGVLLPTQEHILQAEPLPLILGLLLLQQPLVVGNILVALLFLLVIVTLLRLLTPLTLIVIVPLIVTQVVLLLLASTPAQMVEKLVTQEHTVVTSLQVELLPTLVQTAVQLVEIVV